MGLRRLVPVGIDLLGGKMVGIPLLITIMHEDTLEASDAQMRHAHGAKSDMVVFNLMS